MAGLVGVAVLGLYARWFWFLDEDVRVCVRGWAMQWSLWGILLAILCTYIGGRAPLLLPLCAVDQSYVTQSYRLPEAKPFAGVEVILKQAEVWGK